MGSLPEIIWHEHILLNMPLYVNMLKMTTQDMIYMWWTEALLLDSYYVNRTMDQCEMLINMQDNTPMSSVTISPVFELLQPHVYNPCSTATAGISTVCNPLV